MKLAPSIIVAVLAAVASCPAAERRILSTAPDRRFAIVEERAESGERDYYFVRRADGRQLGFVLGAEHRHEISNVAIVASWNPRSTKVALLLFYGTKLSELLLFHKADDDTFVPVALKKPDPMAIYRERTGKTLPEQGDGYNENGVGSWPDEDTVLLLSGEAKQTEDQKNSEEYLHFLVTFRAHIVAHHSELTRLKLTGPLTNVQSQRFLKKWRIRS